MITVINVRALPENAQIMMERKFCGRLTFHKVHIGNRMRAMSAIKCTNNSQNHAIVGGGERTTDRKLQVNPRTKYYHPSGNLGQYSFQAGQDI